MRVVDHSICKLCGRELHNQALRAVGVCRLCLTDSPMTGQRIKQVHYSNTKSGRKR
jgi:hypothetical protein